MRNFPVRALARPAPERRSPARALGVAALLTAATLTGCSSSDDTAATSTDAATSEAVDATGVRVVSPADASAIIESAPADLVVLDVRTPEEFAESHLEDAINIDIYAADFADQLAALDPEVPYVLYCRSGNRSGQAREMMVDLGFTDVADVDGGIVAWESAGLPVVS